MTLIRNRIALLNDNNNVAFDDLKYIVCLYSNVSSDPAKLNYRSASFFDFVPDVFPTSCPSRARRDRRSEVDGTHQCIFHTCKRIPNATSPKKEKVSYYGLRSYIIYVSTCVKTNIYIYIYRSYISMRELKRNF